MDSNAHSHEGGSDEDNDRGTALSEYFDQNQLYVMNKGDKPTFMTKRSKSIIDLTVANSSAVDLSIEGWEVLDTHNFSDHKYIKFSVGEYTPFKKCFRNFKKANWEYFKANLDNYPQQIDIVDCVEQVEREGLAYVESLYLLMDSVCPYQTALPHKPMSWWNNELQDMRKQVHILSRRRDKTDLDG